MATNVTFDVLSLTSNGITTTKTDVFSAPPIQLQDEKLAEADGSVIVKKTLGPKVFSCEGYMQAVDVPTLDVLLDTFKRGLNKQEQNFDIDYAGSTRRYIATPRNIAISRDNGLNSAGFTVEFFCANPVGADTTSSSLLSATTVTSSSSTTGITVNGSYKAQPVILVAVNSLTGSTTNTITISNDSTLRGLSVTRAWSAGDVLEIDCLNQTVYVNNGVVTFSGQFPTWEPGSSAIDYLDDFSARNVSISASYTIRYL